MQQVNLLPSILKPNYQPLNFKNLLVGLFLGIGIAVSYSFFELNNINEKKIQLDEISGKIEKIEIALSVFNNNLNVNKRKDSTEFIKNLETQLSYRIDLLALLEKNNLANNDQGFANAYLSLGIAHIEGVSVSHFEFLRGGYFLKMSGNAIKPELVPRYLQQLKQQPGLAKVEMGSLTMQWHEEKLYLFHLSEGEEIIQQSKNTLTLSKSINKIKQKYKLFVKDIVNGIWG